MAEVTIATSVYNKERWLERCLDSFVRQTFRDLEILIVDNASTDGSTEIIKKYAAADPRIRVIRLEENTGPSGGYELAIGHIRTEYFALCDSDDYIDENYIEVLCRKITEANADLSMCTDDWVWEDGTARVPRRPGKDVVLTAKDVPAILPQLLQPRGRYLGFYLEDLGALWGKLYRTSFIRRNHLNYAKEDWNLNDWLFNFRVYKHMTRMVYTEETSYHFFQSPGSVMRARGVNRNLCGRITRILNKFDAEARDVMTPRLNEAMNKLFFMNAKNIFEMYSLNYPKDVTMAEIVSLCGEFAQWERFRGITLRNHDGVKPENVLNLWLMKRRMLIPLLVWRLKIKRRLLPNKI